LNVTSPALRPQKETPASNVAGIPKGLSKEGSREVSHTVETQRFHVKSTSSRDAARDAAERRWTTAFADLCATTPEVYGLMIDAIDEPISSAATALELHKRGSGLPFVLDALRDRLPALHVQLPTASTEDADSSNQPSTSGLAT
jgi:hypothetical protein